MDKQNRIESSQSIIKIRQMLVYSILLSCEHVAPKGSRIVVVVYEDERWMGWNYFFSVFLGSRTA